MVTSFYNYHFVINQHNSQLQLFLFYFSQEYPLNPKAVSLGELYGEFDLNTNEWTDGILSSVMRQTCAG